MGESSRLSEAEGYIMEFFWAKGPMATPALAALVAEKGWKPTTLLTFLSRLVSKGMLGVQKQGKQNLYSPLVTKNEYRARESRAFLNDMYGGSAAGFLAAMAQGRGLSPQDIAELRAWLDSQEAGHE